MKKPPIDYLCTLGEAAAALGVTQSRAQQIEASALRKLRGWMDQRGLTWLDLSTEPDCAEIPLRAEVRQ